MLTNADVNLLLIGFQYIQPKTLTYFPAFEKKILGYWYQLQMYMILDR